MNYELAADDYRRGLSSHYEDWFRAVPSHMRITNVIKVKERIYPHHDQELVDYLFCYADGTCDARSLGPLVPLPRRGQQYNRLQPSPKDFVTWTPSDEELNQLL